MSAEEWLASAVKDGGPSARSQLSYGGYRHAFADSVPRGRGKQWQTSWERIADSRELLQEQCQVVDSGVVGAR